MNKIEAVSTITKIDPEQGLVEVEVISNFKGITHKMQVRWEDQTHDAANGWDTPRKLYFNRKVFGCAAEELKPAPRFFSFFVTDFNKIEPMPVDMMDDKTDFCEDVLIIQKQKAKRRINIKETQNYSLFTCLMENIQLASVIAFINAMERELYSVVSFFAVSVIEDPKGAAQIIFPAQGASLPEMQYYFNTSNGTKTRCDKTTGKEIKNFCGADKRVSLFSTEYAKDPVELWKNEVNAREIGELCNVCGWIHDAHCRNFTNPYTGEKQKELRPQAGALMQAMHENLDAEGWTKLNTIKKGSKKNAIGNLHAAADAFDKTNSTYDTLYETATPGRKCRIKRPCKE